MSRFFTKKDEILKIKDTNIAVCNQWGKSTNIDKFINHARGLGFKIKEVR